MHGCDYRIGCLSGTADRVGQGLCGDAFRLGQDLNGIVSRIGQDLNGIVSRIGGSLNGSVSRWGESLNGRVHLICTINQEYFLEVNPDVVWLTQDMLSGEFEINSNVVWEIV